MVTKEDIERGSELIERAGDTATQIDNIAKLLFEIVEHQKEEERRRQIRLTFPLL